MWGALVSLCRTFWEIPEGRVALCPHKGSESRSLQCVWHEGAGHPHCPGRELPTPPSSPPLTWE